MATIIQEEKNLLKREGGFSIPGMKKVVLFVPGYFGSTLVERQSKALRWVRVSDFFSNKWDLAMTESYSDLPQKNDLMEGDLLFKVSVIPKVLEIESYEKTIKHLQKFCVQTNRVLHWVTYDWRDDFHASVLKIADKIESLSAEGYSVEVVAHSMGGYLMSYYLRYGRQDFPTAVENWEGSQHITKLAIVASPLRGVFSLFKHMREGSNVLRNKKLMGSLDYTTFKSTYFFLPHSGHQLAQVMNGKSRDYFPMNLMNVDNFKKYSWGPYEPKHLAEVSVNEEKFQSIIERAKKFHQLMEAPTSVSPQKKIPLLVFRGIGRPTYFYPTFKKNELCHEYSYHKNQRVDGDGIVADFSSVALPWFNEHHLVTKTNKEEHLKILSHYKSQKLIHDFLIESDSLIS